MVSWHTSVVLSLPLPLEAWDTLTNSGIGVRSKLPSRVWGIFTDFFISMLHHT